MSSSSPKKKKITLKSSDGENFEIDEAVAMQMQTIMHIIEEEDWANDVIPVPNVYSTSLSKVVEYCNNHAQDSSQADHTTKALFDSEFINVVDTTGLFDLLLAANYLNIKTLMDLTCQHLADMIKNYTVEEVREFFKIDNDFSPEEEAEVRRENAWAFEP